MRLMQHAASLSTTFQHVESQWAKMLIAVVQGAGQHVSSEKFYQAFIAATSLILVSEIGDRTFFIAAIMSMRYRKLAMGPVFVFLGAYLSLALMTILGAVACAWRSVTSLSLWRIHP